MFSREIPLPAIVVIHAGAILETPSSAPTKIESGRALCRAAHGRFLKFKPPIKDHQVQQEGT